MSAAITASDEGKKVIIVESQSMAGGNTNSVEGGMNAAGTKYQDKNAFKEDKGVEKTLKTASESTAEEYTEKGVENIRKLAAVVQEQYDAYKQIRRDTSIHRSSWPLISSSADTASTIMSWS